MSLSLITLELVLRNILLNDSWLLGLLVPKPPHTPCMQRTHFLCATPPHPSPVGHCIITQNPPPPPPRLTCPACIVPREKG
jgi:hypothetical protein